MKYYLPRILVFSVIFIFSCIPATNSDNVFTQTNRYSIGQQQQLSIPKLLPITEKNGKKIVELNAHESTHTFTSQATPTLAYNDATYLGPTIKLKKNDSVLLSVKNNLRDATTLHQHGLILPADSDGNVHQPIARGTTWTTQYDVMQDAGTFWYHPHRMGTTANQVYAGLAGMIIIEDEFSQSLSLPSEYGVDDIPLIIQDKLLTRQGDIPYIEDMHYSRMGYIGDTILVNGIITPEFTVTRNIIRLRILNGSNFGVHTYSINDVDAYLIATDGGFIEETTKVSSLTLTTGERREVLIDFSSTTASKINFYVSVHGESRQLALSFNIKEKKDVGSKIPGLLKAKKEITVDTQRLNTKVFNLTTSNMSNGTSINGRSFNLNRVDFDIPEGEYEIWEVRNVSRGRGMMGGMMGQLPHSFHIHSTLFTVLSYNGNTSVPLEYQGLHDTVLLLPNTTVKLLVQFTPHKGLFLYHCHLLEHEDAGMMGQFEVL